MDIQTISTSLAAVVGLLSNFSAERGHQDVLDIKDFTQWLREHGHREVLSAIEQSTRVSVSIKAVLAEGRDELLTRLAKIEGVLAIVAANQGALGELAMSLAPGSTLSMQAKEILAAFESRKSGKALVVQIFEEKSLAFVDVPGGEGYEPSEPRFFEADLDELVRFGLCSRSVKHGETLYQLTRQGATVAQAVLGADSRLGIAKFAATQGTPRGV